MKTEEKTTRKNKERIPVWLYPSTLEAIDRNMEGADCKSRSEFLNNAACYYAGYVSGKDAVEYLPPMLVSALRSTVQNTENRISSILYKLRWRLL